MLSFYTAPKSERVQGGKPSPWEPFQNRTHNGIYWALHRWNDRFMGGVQVMNTRGGQPRRFGSEASAQKTADAENNAAKAA